MEEIQTVPLAAYESLSSRMFRIIKYGAICWAISMIAMGLVIVISFSYTEEVVTETTEVAQEADDYGSNTFSGGDYYGGAPNGQNNKDESQTV